MELLAFNNTEIILLTSFCLFFILQAIYYFGIYNRIHAHNNSINKGEARFSSANSPLSVIIYAKNESENLQKHLPYILEQDYPEYEVIVVNDGSTDESEDVLTILADKYPHLYHTFTPDSARYISRKKLALTLGIKASKYDWLVFTEANCKPVSSDWLKLIARNFTEGTDIVLGYSGYEKGKGWLYLKTAFDNFFFSVRFLNMALLHMPFMGIGRNLAYKKELFFRNKGFSAHLNLRRGDDDLFINGWANRTNTRVETSLNAMVKMQPITYSKEWKEEKISYAATSHYFKGFQRYILGFETLTRMMFYGLFITLLIMSILQHQWVILGISCFLYILRFLFQSFILNRTAKELEEQKYYLLLPIYDILQPLNSLGFKLIRKFRRKSEFMRK